MAKKKISGNVHLGSAGKRNTIELIEELEKALEKHPHERQLSAEVQHRLRRLTANANRTLADATNGQFMTVRDAIAQALLKQLRRSLKKPGQKLPTASEDRKRELERARSRGVGDLRVRAIVSGVCELREQTNPITARATVHTTMRRMARSKQPWLKKIDDNPPTVWRLTDHGLEMALRIKRRTKS